MDLDSMINENMDLDAMVCQVGSSSLYLDFYTNLLLFFIARFSSALILCLLTAFVGFVPLPKNSLSWQSAQQRWLWASMLLVSAVFYILQMSSADDHYLQDCVRIDLALFADAVFTLPLLLFACALQARSSTQKSVSSKYTEIGLQLSLLRCEFRKYS